MSKLRCLLIGGAGFIGHYLAQTLLSSGRDVTVLSRRVLHDVALNPECKYVQGDFSDLSVLG
ncbi:MAG: NAD-dependent epimerase/dehydratase family protein, partial [Nitrosomonadales bacterium]|nr:NAD-dependent epimerase/dehydratase family protein [Nitrosomonadales bacterium]